MFKRTYKEVDDVALFGAPASKRIVRVRRKKKSRGGLPVKAIRRLLKKKIRGRSKKTVSAHKKVHFSLPSHPYAYQVAVVGSFNRWNVSNHPMKKTPSGTWVATIGLAPGQYRYRFLIDNLQWKLDPHAESVVNDFGGLDSLVRVK